MNLRRPRADLVRHRARLRQMLPEHRQRALGERAQIGIAARAGLVLEQADRLAVRGRAGGREIRDVELAAALAAQRLHLRIDDLRGLHRHALALGELTQRLVQAAVIVDHPLRERAHVGGRRAFAGELARLHLALAGEPGLVDEFGVHTLRALRDLRVVRVLGRIHDIASDTRVRRGRLARHLRMQRRRAERRARGARDDPSARFHR
ncbi:Uncharacterised protein [Burkholderia pseudomallei]|nr:Uncharacterised protein [Burkholderia pseudomallei]